jgi:hypothetical protein
MNHETGEDNILEKIAEILFTAHTDECDSGCGWRLKDEIESETTRQIQELVEQQVLIGRKQTAMDLVAQYKAERINHAHCNEEKVD